MQVIPAVDVLEGRAVRLLRGDYDAVTRYGDDPYAVMRRWRDEGADLVHVVDLGGAKTGCPDPVLLERLAATVDVPFQLGGGIRTSESAAAALTAGATQVVAGSALLGDGAGEFASAIGPERIVAALDVRHGRARGSGWLDDGVPFQAALSQVVALGVGSLLITGIETDGTMDGPDVTLLEETRAAAPGCRIIASGGVGSLDDLTALAALGADAVVIGRALYEGRFSLSAAIDRVS